jgi:hypothetical protein
MLSGYLLNVNKKKEFSSNILSILQVSDVDKLKYDIKYTINNKIFSNDELIEKIIDNNLYDVFKYVIQTNTLYFNNLKIEKLFTLDFSKKNKYFDVILENMNIDQLNNLISSLTFKEDNDEIIFEKILKKIIYLENEDDTNIKKLINLCCFNNKLSYIEIVLLNKNIKLNYNNSEPLYKIIISHLLCDMQDIFNFVVSKGARVKDREETFLIEAINYNKISIVNILLDKYKLSVNICNDLPIRKAYDTGNWELLIKILEKSTSETPIFINQIFNIDNFINNIKIFPIKCQPIEKEKNICSISIEEIMENELYVKCSNCKNNFKSDLLKEWLIVSKNNNQTVECPLCRKYWNNYRIYKNNN